MYLRDEAKLLRKNLTTPERILWSRLRARRLGVKFRRQMVIGTYILDFVSLECRLVVEVDGRQHLNCEADSERDMWLESQGFKVIRFWNVDVRRRLESVVAEIERQVALRPRRDRRCSASNPLSVLPAAGPPGKGDTTDHVFWDDGDRAELFYL